MVDEAKETSSYVKNHLDLDSINENSKADTNDNDELSPSAPQDSARQGEDSPV